MKRYSIMARPPFCDHDVEIAQVDSNPDSIVTATQEKRWKGRDSAGRVLKTPRYEHVYFIDRGEQQIKRD